MFNDILIQKTTTEQAAEPARSPYRPDPAASDLTCLGCHRVFPAAQAVAGCCRSCAPSIDAALEAVKGFKADYTDHGGNDRKRDFGLALVMVGVLAAIVLTVFYVKHRLRTAHREDVEATFSDEARALQEQSHGRLRD